MTKQDSARLARPTRTWPKCAQLTCACSPGKVSRRRNGSRIWGRKRATVRRNWTTLPGPEGTPTTVVSRLVNAGRAQPRMLVQDLPNELQVRIDHGGPHGLGATETLCLDGIAHGIRMHDHFLDDGADFPMLGEKIASNLGTNFGTDHGLLTFVVECVETDR